MGPSALGAFNIILTTIQTFEVTSQAGLDYGLSCAVTDNGGHISEKLFKVKAKDSLDILRLISLLMLIPLGIWLYTNENMFIQIGGASFTATLPIIAFACINESMSSLRWQIILLCGKTREYALRQGLFMPLKLLFAYMGSIAIGLPGAIIGYVLLTGCQNWWSQKKLSIFLAWDNIKRTNSNLREKLQLMGLGFPLYITNSISAIVFLPLLASVAEDAGLQGVGYLRVGQLLVQAFTLVPASILPILFIKLRHIKDKEAEIMRTTEPTLLLVWCGGMLALLGYSLIDNQLVSILFGDDFAEAVKPTRILILCAVLDSVNQVLHTPLLASRRIALFALSQNGAAGMAALVGILLIPSNGLSGYLIAKLLFSWLPVIIYCVDSWKKTKDKNLLPLLLSASIGMTVLCWWEQLNEVTSAAIMIYVFTTSTLELWSLRNQVLRVE